VQTTIRLDTAEFRRDLARASDAVVNRVMPKAINRTAFEILDAEKAEAARSLKFAGASTRTYLSGRGSFRFDGARAGHLEARITPRPQERAQAILAKQQRGATVTPAHDESIEVRGMLAIPVNARRGARGRVRKADLPAALLGPGGRGFIAGNAILKRTRQIRGARRAARFVFGSAAEASRHVGRTRTVVMYALAPKVTVPAVFEFYRAARETALRVFPRKAIEEFAKTRLPVVNFPLSR
jgi:hypothetical protein